MSAKNLKQVTVHVVTKPDEELEFYVQKNIRGQELFDLVCRVIGLREHCYFGLYFECPNQQPSWIRMNKKIRSDLGEDISTTKLYLRVEFYPIDVETGLILELTTHLFFMHVKAEILSESIYCPAEEAILLASYAVQAKYGDFDSDIHKKFFLANDQLLPNRVLSLYKLSSEEWEEKIVKWYSKHCQGLSRYQAEMGYLKTAQDLEMYGVGYYRIQNELNTELWLGIHSTGINVYEADNKLIPKVSFLWSEIKNISFKNKQIWIQPMEKEVHSFHFLSLDVCINRKILLLCSGNHDMYMKSKKPDSLEIQIMKSQAQEAREQKHREQNRLYKEIRRRIEETQARMDMEKRLQEYSSRIEDYRGHLAKAEETTDLLAEKALIAEEEARLLLKKAAELETEVKKLQNVCSQKEEERTYLESHIQHAETSIHQILQDSDRRAQEMLFLKKELDQWRQSEKDATEKLMELTNNQHMVTYFPQTASYPIQQQQQRQHSTQQQQQQQHEGVAGAGATTPTYGYENTNISNVFQQESSAYVEKTKYLERRLWDLTSEIEDLKVNNSPDMLDKIHFESVGRGENKNTTLQKLQAASTNARVRAYQELRSKENVYL